MEQPEQSFQKIGRYELIRKIATGGMAELFLSRFTGPGGFEKRCALKRILPQYAEDAEFTRMFLNEARVAAMFDHPNLVQIFELGTEEATGQHFIAMELISGMDLRQLQRLCRERGRDFPAEIAAHLISQALDGLAYVHEFRDGHGTPLNLVHRDVSPQNILVSYEGGIKLVDFGIAKATVIEGHTQTGMLKGKIAYMSPEQASGEPIDARSDLFSLGAVLYELVTGVKPFRAANEIMTLKAILESDPQPVTYFVPDCPVGIEHTINRALAKRREDRYQNARAMQVDLLNTLRSCPVTLDRHVVAQFVKSLTEGETDRFDATQLKIPRVVAGSEATGIGPRFAAGQAMPVDEYWRREAAAVFQEALDTPSGRRRAPTHTMGSSPPGVSSSAPRAMPMAPPIAMANHSASGTDSGVFPHPSVDLSMINEASVTRAGPSRTPVYIGGGALVLAALVIATAVALDAPSEPTIISALPVAELQAPTHERAAPPPPVAPTPPPRDPVVAPSPTPTPSPAPDRVETKHKEAAPAPHPREERTSHRRNDDRRNRREREREAAPSSAGGKLTLATVPRGLVAKIGDKTLGRTPLEAVDVPLGKSTVSLVHAKLGIARSLSIDVKKDQHVKESITIGKAILKVNSRPWAEVYVDGQLVGKTPLQRPVYEGRHEVKLVNPDEGERIQIVDVAGGEERDIRVKF